MTATIAQLCEEWLEAKHTEATFIAARRAAEDALADALALTSNLEGSLTNHEGDYAIKVTGRIDRKVDSEMLQELAAEHGLTEHLSSLCRWKPELNMTAWKAADESITGPLARAITAKPGRPSFSITFVKKD